MTRAGALAFIRAEVAREGLVTRLALRAYVENRVGAAAFHRVVKEGLALRRRLQEGLTR